MFQSQTQSLIHWNASLTSNTRGRCGRQVSMGFSHLWVHFKAPCSRLFWRVLVLRTALGSCTCISLRRSGHVCELASITMFSSGAKVGQISLQPIIKDGSCYTSDSSVVTQTQWPHRLHLSQSGPTLRGIGPGPALRGIGPGGPTKLTAWWARRNAVFCACPRPPDSFPQG